MQDPTPEAAQRKKAVIEARLQSIRPIWEGRGTTLYLADDGYYVVRIVVSPSLRDYIGISPEGELKDLAGYAISSYDRDYAARALNGAHHHEMAARVEQRYRHL